MAYFRGETYIWHDESGFHFWAKDGYDNWDICGWGVDEDESRLPGYEKASGVSIHDEIMDTFVMMRVAQLIEEGRTDELIDRAANEFGGNFGNNTLQRNATKLKRAFRAIKMEALEPHLGRQKDAALESD